MDVSFVHVLYQLLCAFLRLEVSGSEERSSGYRMGAHICDWLQECSCSIPLQPIKTKIKTISSYGTRRIFILSPNTTMTTQEKTVLSTEEKTRPVTEMTQEVSSSLSDKVKKMVTTIIAAALLIWAKPAMSQTKQETEKDSVKTETKKPETKWWSFFISPEYSPTDKTWAIRIEGSGGFHGIDAGWFLDLTGTEKDPVGVSSAFGKFTLSKALFPKSKVLKWTSVAIEYTLSTATPDKVRWGVMYAHKLWNWAVVFKVYPVSEKWFEPFVLAYVDQSWKKFKMSTFFSTDIKSKSFYGESDISYQATKHIAPFVQGRLGWCYTSKPHPDAYLGLRVKL